MTHDGNLDTKDDACRMAGECIAGRARRLNRMVSRIYDQALRPRGLRITQMNLLVVIDLAGPVRPTVLGRLVDLEKSTTSRNVKLLVERGWVRIKGGGDDLAGRLELTASGRKMLAGATPAWRAAQERTRALLGEDAAATLEAMVERLHEA